MDVCVVDSHGQLPLLYTVCEIVFVGGTLISDDIPGCLARPAVAGCAVLCGAKSPEIVRLAEELNNAANVTAEESANAVYTAGVHTDDLSPHGAGTQPSSAVNATERFNAGSVSVEGQVSDDDDNENDNDNAGGGNVPGHGVADLASVSLRVFLPDDAGQPGSAPAALAESRQNSMFGRYATTHPSLPGLLGGLGLELVRCLELASPSALCCAVMSSDLVFKIR